MPNRCWSMFATGLLLLFAVPTSAQTPPPQPGREHKKLEMWVGDWVYEGQGDATPTGPAGKITGRSSARPILGGLFVEFQGEWTVGTSTTEWREIDGYDPVSKKYFWNSYASDGGVEVVTYTVEGNTVSYSGTSLSGGKQTQVRGTIVFAPDWMSRTNKSEMSVDGKTWMPAFELRVTKAKSSPK